MSLSGIRPRTHQHRHRGRHPGAGRRDHSLVPVVDGNRGAGNVQKGYIAVVALIGLYMIVALLLGIPSVRIIGAAGPLLA